jgi:cell division initiation protein
MEKFRTTVGSGYDKLEVNSFVNEVTREYENMLNKLKQKDEQLRVMKEQLEHYKSLETTLNKAVLVAEDSSNIIKKVAHDEAKLIVEEAKKNASHIINDALIEAEKTELEADRLRRSLKIYKARIKSTIEEQLTIVDDIEKISDDYKG